MGSDTMTDTVLQVCNERTFGAYSSKDRPKVYNVRLVQKGDKFGRERCLTHDEDDPLVEFYDTDMEGAPGFDLLGQFVTRYKVSVLLRDASPYGLCLDGSVPCWNVEARPLKLVKAWLRQHVGFGDKYDADAMLEAAKAAFSVFCHTPSFQKQGDCRGDAEGITIDNALEITPWIFEKPAIGRRIEVFGYMLTLGREDDEEDLGQYGSLGEVLEQAVAVYSKELVGHALETHFIAQEAKT